MPKDDIPNTVLGRFFTFEMLGMLMVIAVGWGTLTTKVNSLDSQVSEAKEIQAKESQESKQITGDLSREVNQINRKVDVLGNNQEHFKQQIDTVAARLERIQQLLEQGR